MESFCPIHFELSINSISGHLIDVELTVSSPNKEGQILSLPAWIPGSYMIRDFAKNITHFTAWDQQGNSVEIQKVDKQTWQASPIEGKLTVKYQIYCFDHSVRSAYICDEYAFLNGTSGFLRVEGQTQERISVNIRPTAMSPSWQVATAMQVKQIDEKGFGQYRSNDYSDLIEHPIMIGELDRQHFMVREVPMQSVIVGGHFADHQRIVQDLKTICEHHFTLFDSPTPIDRYVFMTMICDKGFGGLEHTYSTALMYDRNTLVTPIGDNPPSEGYQSFLGLCSHEFLHTWHVKRNRPLELMNATLMEETYTEQLWIYEGFTSYYDDISLARCKLVQVDDYLRVLGENLTRLERNPGKDKQSVTESSFYTWNKFYKQNEGSINHIVSYYTKGAIIALCLDLKMRQASNGKFSLDHLMQQLWRQYGSQNIGTLPNVIDTLLREEFALDFSNFIEEATTTTQPLPVEELLATVGVELNRRPAASLTDKGGKSIKACLKNEFGASLKKSSLGASVTKVIENTPAYHAGIQVNDHLIALNQWQIDADSFSQHLDRCSPGEEIQLTLLRDKKLKQCVMQVQAAPHDTIYLVVKEKDKVNQWMGL